MDKSDKLAEQWYVLFKRSELKHWIFKWLDSEISHVYAVKESPGGEFWIVVNGLNSHLQVDLHSKLDYPHIRLLCPDSVILSIKAIIQPDSYRQSLCLCSCVDVVKSALGIKDFWCWTPRQLYTRLTSGQTKKGR